MIYVGNSGISGERSWWNHLPKKSWHVCIKTKKSKKHRLSCICLDSRIFSPLGDFNSNQSKIHACIWEIILNLQAQDRTRYLCEKTTNNLDTTPLILESLLRTIHLDSLGQAKAWNLVDKLCVPWYTKFLQTEDSDKVEQQLLDPRETNSRPEKYKPWLSIANKYLHVLFSVDKWRHGERTYLFIFLLCCNFHVRSWKY